MGIKVDGECIDSARIIDIVASEPGHVPAACEWCAPIYFSITE
jgi:hypothetical protein